MVSDRVISRIGKLSLLHPSALRFWLQLWLQLTCKTKPGLVLLLQSLKSSSQHLNLGKPQQRHFSNKTEEFLQANFGRQINKAHQWRKRLQNVEARTRNFRCCCSYQCLLQTPSIHRLEVQDIFCCFDWLLERRIEISGTKLRVTVAFPCVKQARHVRPE